MGLMDHLVPDIDDSPRELISTFEVPGFGKFGFLNSPLSFWLQLALSIAIQAVVSAVYSVAVYYFIVKKRGSPSSFLLGYGVVIPSLFLLPQRLIPLFGIRNLTVMIGLSAITIIIPFRCMEAMYGTTLVGIERNLATYCGYFTAVVPLVRDPKTGVALPATRGYVTRKMRILLVNSMLLTITSSVYYHFGDAPIPSTRHGGPVATFWGLFHWRHIADNLFFACLTSLTVCTGPIPVGLAITLLTGKQTMLVMDNPIIFSTSPSDFWGRRWNRLIHESIKNGIYKPMRSLVNSRFLAVVVSFVSSGLLHEFVLTIVALKAQLYPWIGKNFRPRYGNHFLFFAWNGVVIILEYTFGGMAPFRWASANLPRPLITCFVLFMVLPVSHLFTDEYERSGFYSDLCVGFPVVVKL